MRNKWENTTNTKVKVRSEEELVLIHRKVSLKREERVAKEDRRAKKKFYAITINRNDITLVNAPSHQIRHYKNYTHAKTRDT